jgi:hypothetical protein
MTIEPAAFDLGATADATPADERPPRVETP